MCGINDPHTQRLQAELLGKGIDLIYKATEAILIEELPQTNKQPNVLAEATRAYQQGKITKSQYIAVINALDERSEPPKHSYIAWLEDQGCIEKL